MPSHVLVLISPKAGGLLERMARDIVTLRDGIRWGDPVVLAEREALEIPVALDDPSSAGDLQGMLARIFEKAPVDLALLPAANRRKLLLVADMDSTIIQQECIDEMADVRGLKPRIAAITERAMRGELVFEAALRERLGLLAGITEAELVAVYRHRITLMPGARTLVATMCANDASTALVSGGFTFFTSRVAAAVGFDTNHANTLEFENGRLTGRVAGPILGREAKRATLERYRSELGLAAEDTLAVGDGANDLAMIAAAGLGVAFRAKPVVTAQAHAAITHGDLTALLYLQGYTKEEFVEG